MLQHLLKQKKKKPLLKPNKQSELDPKQCAIGLLANREHSRVELERKLRQREFEGTVIEQVIEQLSASGLQSDERFTEAYCRHRSRKGYGPVRIAQELRERGVEDGLIAEYVNADDESWSLACQAVWQKKFGGKQAADFNARAKQMKFLQYRGFNAEQIRAVM